MKFSGKIGNGPVNKLLHFGGDPDLDSSSRTDSPDGGADIVTLVRHALAVVCTVPVVLVVNIVVDFGEFDSCLRSVADTCGSTCSANVVVDFNEFSYSVPSQSMSCQCDVVAQKR